MDCLSWIDLCVCGEFCFPSSFLANFWMHFLTVRLRFLPEIPLTLPICRDL